MGCLAVWTNSSLVDQGASDDFSLDLESDIEAKQEESNDFVVTLPISVSIGPNSAFYVDGTEWGGLVQKRGSDTTVDGTLEWRGRTWIGVLADRVLKPPAGSAYSYANGTVAECIEDLLESIGLDDVFGVGDCPSTSYSSYQYPRYPNGDEALFSLLGNKSLRPTFKPTISSGALKVLIGAEAIATLSEEADGEKADVAMVKVFTPYNHIIALGQGELEERTVVERFADSSGNISSTQSITGTAERTYKYDYPSAEDDELVDAAEKKLKEFQGQGSVAVSLKDGAELHLGDYVQAYDHRIDESVTARVTKCVVKIENGITTCAWSAGE